MIVSPALKKTLNIFSVVALLVTGACKKPVDSIGSDVGILDSTINAKYIDTMKVEVYTIREDSVRSDRSNFGTLGEMWDPIFGKTDANVYANFKLNQLYGSEGLGNVTAVDSAYLSLTYSSSGYFGDITKLRGPQRITVYRLLTDLTYYSTTERGYFSNLSLPYDSLNPLGSAVIVPRPYDSVRVAGVNQGPQIRIKLRNDFAYSLITANPSAFLSDEAFASYFKGVYVTSDAIADFDSKITGAILYLLMPGLQSKISIYYRDNNGNQVFSASVKETGVWINRFRHEYSGSDIQFTNGKAPGVQNIYIQPMAGCIAQVNLPDLSYFRNNKSKAINKVELIFHVDQEKTGNYILPQRLYLVRKASDGLLYKLPDDQTTGTIGGIYDQVNKQYKFSITFHVSNLIQGITPNDPLILDMDFKSSRAERVVLNGTAASDKKVEFKLFYTELN